MDLPSSQIFVPASFQELFSTWGSLNSSGGSIQGKNSDITLFAGGTGLLMGQSEKIPKLPKNIISLEKIAELRKISRTERYIEIGSMVKLNQIINLGKIVPEVLTRCLEHIADPQIRSQATIGGNICDFSGLTDASGPMIALDAQYELRGSQSSKWISASRFSAQIPNLQPLELLTRIRVPLEPWNYTWYRKLNIPGSNKSGGGILFILKNQKDILTDIHVVYSGKVILKDKNSESMLSGKHLPLDRKDAIAFLDGWKNYLSSLEGDEKAIFPGEPGNSRPDLLKAQILLFLESILRHISD